MAYFSVPLGFNVSQHQIGLLSKSLCGYFTCVDRQVGLPVAEDPYYNFSELRTFIQNHIFLPISEVDGEGIRVLLQKGSPYVKVRNTSDHVLEIHDEIILLPQNSPDNLFTLPGHLDISLMFPVTTNYQNASKKIIDRWCKSLLNSLSVELDWSLIDVEFLATLNSLFDCFKDSTLRDAMHGFLTEILLNPQVFADISPDRYNQLKTISDTNRNGHPLPFTENNKKEMRKQLEIFAHLCCKFHNFLMPSALGVVTEKANCDGVKENIVLPGEMFIMRMYNMPL